METHARSQTNKKNSFTSLIQKKRRKSNEKKCSQFLLKENKQKITFPLHLLQQQHYKTINIFGIQPIAINFILILKKMYNRELCLGQRKFQLHS